MQQALLQSHLKLSGQRERQLEDLKKGKARLQKATLTSLAPASPLYDDASERTHFARLSHEIRNAVHVISGVTNLLFDHSTVQQLPQLENLRATSDFLLNLVNKVLDYSKLEEGNWTIQENEVDLHQMLDTLAGVYEFQLSQKGLLFEFYRDVRLPQQILSDKTVIYQILQNLLSNALKFTHRGHVSLKAVLLKETQDTSWIQLAITDTGRGIAAKDQPLLFNRFSQIQAASDEPAGSGLGLYIVKKWVDLLGGSITVKSEPGVGSSFIVILPLKKVSMPVKQLSSTPALSFQAGAERLKALIVDDSSFHRAYLEQLLSSWKVETISCASGEAALEVVAYEPIDIIFMDIWMPVMDGFETAIRLRNLLVNRSIPIVALTGNRDKHTSEKLQRVGIQEALSKPFSPEDLMKVIAHYAPKGKNPFNKSFDFSKSFDVNALTMLYNDDLEYVKQMFGIFLKNTPSSLTLMEHYLSQQDWPALAEEAHRIKPTFAMVGLGRVSNLGNALEEACRRTATVEITTLFRHFRKAVWKTIDLVHKEHERLLLYQT
ncbi:MAG TPA: ATP-binding protein [Saprospiraceae bacterium]|nr:ATP-binding protein [Saprospiraceae bacterium]HMQ84461.1 ATP-binding protein [Saprospiraceae bacterium]